MFSLQKGKKYIWRAFLHYTSTLDYIPRPLLLNRFASVTIDSWIANQLCSYLPEREQFTVFRGRYSKLSISQQGMPHRSVLSHFFSRFFSKFGHLLQKLILLSILIISLYVHQFLPGIWIAFKHLVCTMGDSVIKSLKCYLSWCKCFPLIS